MSVESQKPDPAVLRKFGQSKKEEELKSKLFKKTQPGALSATQTLKSSLQSSPNKNTLRSDAPLKESFNVGQTWKQQSVNDEMLGGFLRDMEGEFKELNKKQITMGMLQTQQEIMRKHTEILNENQRNIAQMVKDGAKSNKQASKNSEKLTEDAQKQLMKEIIAPINNQIVEIKKMYESTKKLAEEVAGSVGSYKTMVEKNDGNNINFETYQKNVANSFGDYKAMNSNLKDMVLHTQGNLSQVLPENMQIIKQISDLNVQAYSDCIKTLKKQMEDLQKDAEKAEKELEARYKKLAQVPKQGNIKPTDPYYNLVMNGPETSEDVIKNIRSIDFQTSYQIVKNKLGGEFDYEQFNHDISELTKTMYDIRGQALEDLEKYQIDIPSQLELLEYDKQIANATVQGHSILDEIKARYNIPKQMAPPKQQAISPVIFPGSSASYQAEIENVNPQRFDVKGTLSDVLKGKKKTQRPKEFDWIRTVPEEPLPDVEFKRIQDPQEAMKKKAIFSAEFEQPKKAKVPEVQETRKVQFETRESQEIEQRNREREAYENLQVKQARQEEEKKEPQVQVHVSMDRYNVKTGPVNEMEPRERNVDHSFDQAKGSNDMFNRLFEGMILQDIKEQIVFSNLVPKQEAEEPIPFQVREQAQNTRAEQRTTPQLYYPQAYRLPSQESLAIDENLIQQLILEALSEKLKSELQAEASAAQQQEKPKNASLFQPVESKKVPEMRPQVAAQVGNEQLAGLLGLNSPQLPTLIAENILNMFNTAMMQINSSLSKGLPQVTQIETLNNRNKENVSRMINSLPQREERRETFPQPSQVQFTPKERVQEDTMTSPSPSDLSKPNLFSRNKKQQQQQNPRMDTPQGFDVQKERDLRDQVLITEEKPFKMRGANNMQNSLLDALQQEGRNIKEEQDIIRQRKHYFSPGQPIPNPANYQQQQSYYFMNHGPEPIANLSEYYRELQSDSSSDFGKMTETPSHRTLPGYSNKTQKKSKGRRTPSGYESGMLSEGQIFPGMDSATEYTVDSGTELPNFGTSRTEMSYDPRFSSSQRPVITENLFKGLHDDEREPGEISVSEIFKM